MIWTEADQNCLYRKQWLMNAKINMTFKCMNNSHSSLWCKLLLIYLKNIFRIKKLQKLTGKKII